MVLGPWSAKIVNEALEYSSHVDIFYKGVLGLRLRKRYAQKALLLL